MSKICKDMSLNRFKRAALIFVTVQFEAKNTKSPYILHASFLYPTLTQCTLSAKRTQTVCKIARDADKERCRRVTDVRRYEDIAAITKDRKIVWLVALKHCIQRTGKQNHHILYMKQLENVPR